jgi:hypothetical protein
MPFPQIRHCIVCEGARQEVLGKLTLLGFFGLTPDVGVSISDFNKPVTLCFVFAGGPGDGHFSITVRLVAQSGATLPGTSPAEGDLLPGKLTSVFVLYFNAVVPGPGPYKVFLVANGHDAYETKFQFVQGDPQEMQRKQLQS